MPTWKEVGFSRCAPEWWKAACVRNQGGSQFLLWTQLYKFYEKKVINFRLLVCWRESSCCWGLLVQNRTTCAVKYFWTLSSGEKLKIATYFMFWELSIVAQTRCYIFKDRLDALNDNFFCHWSKSMTILLSWAYGHCHWLYDQWQCP